MKAHVICCNDSVRYVIIGDESKAENKLEELYINHRDSYTSDYNRHLYDDSHFWHIHTVEAE